MTSRIKANNEAKRHWIALVIGLVCLIACAVSAFFDRTQFFISYLWTYFFWFGISIGCALVAMIHNLTGGKWGYPIKRFLEAGLANIPLMAILFVPVFFGLRELYPWAHKIQSPNVAAKASYLNVVFFIIRSAVYLLLWSALAFRLRGLSLQQDQTNDPAPTRALMFYSGPGVVLLPLTATFAYVDWVMSIEPAWRSTIFPLVLLAGQTLMAFAFSIILLHVFEKQEPIATTVAPIVYHQLGNLLLTFVLFWTYVAFGQFLIIYSANEPDEISWYLRRIAGGWKPVLILVALFHFLIPFLLLLFRRLKQTGVPLAWISGLLFVIHIVCTYWTIAPPFFSGHFEVSWVDFAAFIGIGGIWFARFLWLLGRAPLLPLNDVRRHEDFVYAET